MKTAIVAALSVTALMAFPAVSNAADASTDTTHTIVEAVLNDLGVDASAELVDLITADVDTVLLNPELVDAVDTALADGSDPAQVIDDITDENFDEQSVLWEENGDEWTASAPAVRPNRHSTSVPDDDSDTDTEAETEVDESPTPRPTASVRPSPNPRPTNSTRPTSTPRPTPSDSGDDDDDDHERDDEDHSDDDD